jgi:outer membrane receptor for ferrienterochelin and colicins
VRSAAAGLILVAAAATAAAQPDDDLDDAPGVDVEDLPPLPPPAALDGEGSDVAVAAATDVEEDVVVGAAKREQSLGNVASAVTVISGDRLRRFGYRTVAEAIRGVAGVFVGDDHMTERVGIRGLHVLGDFNTRVLVLVDGATINEPWGHFAGVGWDAPVSIDDVARIEVIRGPVSSVYGTNAFFGIINIVTRGADQSPRAWGRISGTQFSGGALAAGFAAGGVDRQVRGSVAVLYRGGEPVITPTEIGAGRVDADGARAINAGLVGARDGAFAQVRFYHRERQLPYAPYETTPGERDTRNTDQQILVEGGYTRQVSRRVGATGRVYASRYRFTDYLVYQPDDDNFQDFGDADWAGVEVRSRIDLLDRGRLGVTVGGEVTQIRTESRSHYEGMEEDGVVVPVNFSIGGLYTELDGGIGEWLAFTAGVRLDGHTRFDEEISPRAAVFLDRDDRWGLKFLYAHGFRNPSPYEGFFEDGIDFEANPDIGAEVIDSYEVVAWGRPVTGMSVRLSGFRWLADDIVEQDEGPGGLLQFQNLGELTSTGVELEVTYRDARGWLGFAGATLARVAGSDGEKVPGAPAITAAFGVSSPLIARHVHVSSELLMIGERPTRDPAVDAEPFFGWNLTAYAPNVRGFDVTIGARNLIGRRERVPGQEDFDRSDDLGNPIIVPVLPGEGRELHARIGYRFH